MSPALTVMAVMATWFAAGVLTEYGPAQAQQPAQIPPGAPHGVFAPPEGPAGQPAPPPMPAPAHPPAPASSDVPDPDFCRQLRATFEDYDQDRQKSFAPYLKRCDEAGR